MPSDHDHSQDVFINADGSEELRDLWLIEENAALDGKHSGGICVHDQGTFTITAIGHHSGSLTFRSGSSGRIEGKHSGSLHVSARSEVEVAGDQSGSVYVAEGDSLRWLQVESWLGRFTWRA